MVGENELRRRAPGPRPRPRRQPLGTAGKSKTLRPSLTSKPSERKLAFSVPGPDTRPRGGESCSSRSEPEPEGSEVPEGRQACPQRGSPGTHRQPLPPARGSNAGALRGLPPNGKRTLRPARVPKPRGRLRTPPRPYFGESRKHEGRNAGPAGRAGASAPRPPAEASPSLPFWERIASPVLRSPNTDSGPSIFAAGHTSGCTYTADSWRRFLGPAAATPAAAATQRGPGPAMPQGMLGTPLHLLPRPPGPFSACAAAGQGGKERRGGERRVNVQEVRSRKGGLITFAQLESEQEGREGRTEVRFLHRERKLLGCACAFAHSSAF